MSLHFQRDLESLKKEILLIGGLVEEAINNSVRALKNRDVALAESVINKEYIIDEKEVQIEEECLKILALHQPVATDLRLVVVILKVNNDLERMGDFATNIAQRALFLSEHDPLPYLIEFINDLPVMVQKMVKDTLDALVKMDTEIARSVILADDAVDDINRLMYKKVNETIVADSSTTERAINLLSTSRYLERIADLSTNIAEDVIFMVEGNVIRHDTSHE
ncbi:MAG: phosphate transport system regulatory protein PhoU [SAR86 cluster bacterium]|uniref:Phosphate-specific transport system accessory protein PhoU n=1 Tax=SAR86 cluster bacterium TaxID=2030880 RepID=A0A2A5CEG2_9GAMM|nr:phosphate signaling complex protein PhoU [Gammaproteobacteria bacterium AH-315-E17]PCJ41766.1 MAG: phosphate transport system regulatory protein PhoU [SAR86 cluster bacterium]